MDIMTENDIDTSSGEPFLINTEYLQLNDDTVKDYFILLHSNPDDPYTHGYFYNGKTGEKFPFYPTYYEIWSRPGVDVEYKIIDVDCADGHKEILTRYGNGGTAYHAYDLNIFRYDERTGAMKVIFEQNISVVNSMDTASVKSEINYVDINYKNENCISEINVQQGEITVGDSEYNLNIKPKENSAIKKFLFNSSRNLFEEK